MSGLMLKKRKALCDKLGIGKTKSFEYQKDGLIPPPVKRNSRDGVWAEHEVDAIAAAILAGKSKPEIRAIAAQLTADRQALV